MNILLTNPTMRADEGALFVCTNPTPGVSVTTGTSVPQSFAATTPTFVVKNNASAASGIALWLHSLTVLHVGGTTPASVTSVQSAVFVDTGDRTPTSNQILLAPVNTVPNSRAPNSQAWCCSAGNLTVPAAVNARQVARRQIKGGATVLLDEYELLFGGDQGSSKMPNSASGLFSSCLPAVKLMPQQFALIYLWFPGGVTNAFSHEFELLLSER